MGNDIKKSSYKSDFELLRQKAEELLSQKTSASSIPKSEIEILKLIHELEVHQIELELQNDELVRAKHEAQEAATKFVELFDFAPIGYFTLTKEEEIIALNFSGAGMLGKPRSQLIHSRFGTFVSKHNKHDFSEFLDSVFESEAKETCELVLEPEDADAIWTHLTGVVAEGDGVCHVNVLDITDRKQAEMEILDQRKILRTLIDSLPDLIYFKDIECRKVIANKADVKNIGYQSEEEILGKTDLELFNGKIGKRGYADDLKVINSGMAIIDQLEDFVNKEGVRRWISTTKIPLRNNEGKITGLVGIGHDITERKRIAEELTKSKEKAEESDRLKSAFLANMNHEIRTPMNGIMGFTELLKEPELSGENQENYINIIEQSGNHLLAIIDDIINISKIEAGQMEISVSETNMNDQIDYVFTFFKPEVEKKGIRFLHQKGLPKKEAIVHTDRDKIDAILINLVKNAIKFTEEGSIEFGYVKKGAFLEFFVKDTGSGISNEQKEIIFERFRKYSPKLTLNYEGTGLGLSISKAYVELLGGKIWVKSEIGKGSAFYFTIPHDPAGKDQMDNTEQAGNLPKPVTSRKELKILIAEDDESSEMLIRETIRSYGKKIISVTSGLEAVEVCRSNPDIDLIIMDIRIPGMDGYEATRQIRMFNIKVIIVAQTAFALNNEMQKALDAGCNDYIPKPFKKTALKKLLEKHFSNEPNTHG